MDVTQKSRKNLRGLNHQFFIMTKYLYQAHENSWEAEI